MGGGSQEHSSYGTLLNPESKEVWYLLPGAGPWLQVKDAKEVWSLLPEK